MIQEKWTDLVKGSCSNHYTFKIESAYSNCYSPTTNFSLCAFDADDEALVTIDNNGIAYYIDLSDTPAYKKLGCVGLSTSLTFNPTNKNEILIGLSSTNVKVLKVNDINNFCLLTGHTVPTTNISFYKDYCLTASNKEVIIWQTKSYCKAHQLRLNVKDIVIKKAVFSNLGLIVVLYQSNLIQCWMFQQFDKDNKIDVEKYGLKNVKDFELTKDGKAMIVCGSQNKILVFNTARCDLLKNIDINQNFSGGKQLSVLPLPLDGGANSIVAILTTDCTLKFLSFATSSIIANCCQFETGIKKIAVSNKGYYLACISKHGYIDITFLNKVLSVNLTSSPKKRKEEKKLHSHKIENHLKCVRHAMKEELKLQRLLPILKEFGEYPEKHRKLIWTTIMELPNNKKAYIDLSNKVPREATYKMLQNDSLSDKPRSIILNVTINCLLHWCPVLQECSFLPKLITPFVNVFQNAAILGFESSMFVMLNYCQKWFEYHPLPPLNILGMIENILLEVDPILFNYFCERGITSTEYAWTLLQTTLSEVLATNEWLILWDHLLSLQKPWFLLMCAVAYNIAYRKTITTKLQTVNDFQQFYRTQGHVSVKTILKIAHKLDCDIPHQIHPRRYLKKDITTIPKGPYPPFFQYEFPKYLTDELRGMNLKSLKENERFLRGVQLNAMEVLEERRLNKENENFMKYIQDRRLNEIRKCYENQVQDDTRLLNYTKKQTEDLDPSEYLHNDLKWSNIRKCAQDRIYETEFKRKRSKSKNKNCQVLQEQVDRLEFEVQNLLTRLYNKSSRSKSRSK